MNGMAYRAGRRRSAGFSLIELMIALVLGLMVLGAAFVMFQSNQNSFRANEGLNRIQESARVAFEVMSQDIRSAGGSACSTASVVETTGAQSDAFRDNPITGNASQLTVVSGEDAAYKVTSSTSTSCPSPVRSRWNSAIVVAYSAVSPATLSAMMVPT